MPTDKPSTKQLLAELSIDVAVLKIVLHCVLINVVKEKPSVLLALERQVLSEVARFPTLGPAVAHRAKVRAEQLFQELRKSLGQTDNRGKAN